MTTTELHALRSAQLKALCKMPITQFSLHDADQLYLCRELCGPRLDTRNLSDKALEEIQTLASKYLEQIA